ncbi:MAG: hypothetical protein IPG85_14700 [Bacteroidetes bacterium]|nr:hypothetical protein [Bacteroidota bacterium]
MITPNLLVPLSILKIIKKALISASKKMEEVPNVYMKPISAINVFREEKAIIRQTFIHHQLQKEVTKNLMMRDTIMWIANGKKKAGNDGRTGL